MIITDASGNPFPSLAWYGTVPGVTITDVAGRNGPGTGAIRTMGTSLQWKAPNSDTWGAAVDVSAGGSFTAADGVNEWKTVTVNVAAAFLSAVAEAEVKLRDVFDKAGSCGDQLYGDPVQKTRYLNLGTCEDHYSIMLASVSSNQCGFPAPFGTFRIAVQKTPTLEFCLQESYDGENWSGDDWYDEGSYGWVGSVMVTTHLRMAVRRTVPAGTTPTDKAVERLRFSVNLDGAGAEEVEIRGAYRIFGEAEYRFHIGVDDTPDATADPDLTSSTLDATLVTDASLTPGVYNVSCSKTNGLYDSGFGSIGPNGETFKSINITATGETELPPDPPLEYFFERTAETACALSVKAFIPDDGEEYVFYAADLTINGSPMDGGTLEIDRTGLVTRVDDMDALNWPHGTVISLCVKVGRKLPDDSYLYSTNTELITHTFDKEAPSAPGGADAVT